MRSADQKAQSLSFEEKALAILAMSLPLLYALFSNPAWEDFFITFRHSVNFAEGNGLVFTPGERIHGFTSPLGVLLPAFCYWITGKSGYVGALWLFRILGLFAYAGAVLFGVKALRKVSESRHSWKLFALFFLLDAKAMAYSVNGMETAFLLLFAGLGVWLWQRPLEKNGMALGLCGAGLLWTRPDGVVYIFALALAGLFFFWGRSRWKELAKPALVCACAYLPWFVGAWIYYGSPVPHTVLAKSPAMAGVVNWATLLPKFFGTGGSVFLPIYAYMGGWPWWTVHAANLIGAVCLLYWAVPVKDPIGRASSLVFALLALYLSRVSIFPWYLPGPAFFAWIALAQMLSCGCLALLKRSGVPGATRMAAPLSWMAGASLVLLLGAASVFTIRMLHVQQKEIEWGNRMPIGIWLKEHVKPGERVFSEPLGYFGYFSGAKMLDLLGLVADEIVEVRKKKGGSSSYGGFVEALQPEWLVLRPNEFADVGEKLLAEKYERRQIFDVSDRLASHGYFYGRGYAALDAVYHVFRRSEATVP